MKITNISLACVLAMTLLACGGGSGDDTPAPVTPTAPTGPTAPTTPAPTEPVTPPAPPVVVTPPPYTLSPAIIEASYVAGYPTSVTLSATQTVPFVGVVYVKVVADSDVIDPVVGLSTQSDGSVGVQIKTTASAKPGMYSGEVTVNVCTDPNCASQLAGAPFKLPYAIEVYAPEGGVKTFTLSQLSALEGAADWGTFQGNNLHNGYVPVTLAPAAFTPRWTLTAPATNGIQAQLSEIATGGGQLYMARGTLVYKGGTVLSAYAEADGGGRWDRIFQDELHTTSNPPAYANGRIFASAGSHETTAMYGFDAVSGTQLFKSPMGSQWPEYRAPTVIDGNVYTNGGYYGGLYSFSAATGAQNYFTQLPQYDAWTPAVDSLNMYSYTDGRLQVMDRSTGVVQASIADPHYSWNGYTGTTPVIGSTGLVFAGNLTGAYPNAIVAFDVANRSVRWTATGTFVGSPAVADGLMFALNEGTARLEVRRETDGTVEWTWANPDADAKFVSDVLLTRNLVFVSTGRMTYAIDRTTHATVWSHKASGKLALSANGILYVKDKSRLVAINLK